MSPLTWAARPLKQYALFTGRAPRAEFWWFMLAMCVLLVGAYLIEQALALRPVFWLYGPLTLAIAVGSFIPGLALQVRRLHDTGRSGLWLLALWVPYVIYAYVVFDMITAMGAGRMPDTGSAGLVTVLGLATLAGSTLLIVLFATPGNKGPNRYGEDPYGGAMSRI